MTMVELLIVNPRSVWYDGPRTQGDVVDYPDCPWDYTQHVQVVASPTGPQTIVVHFPNEKLTPICTLDHGLAASFMSQRRLTMCHALVDIERVLNKYGVVLVQRKQSGGDFVEHALHARVLALHPNAPGAQEEWAGWWSDESYCFECDGSGNTLDALVLGGDEEDDEPAHFVSTRCTVCFGRGARWKVVP